MESNKKEVPCREVVELATDYLEDELLQPVRSLLEQHLEECDGCQEYLEQLRQTIRVLRAYGKTCTPGGGGMNELTELFRSWAATSPPPTTPPLDPGATGD